MRSRCGWWIHRAAGRPRAPRPFLVSTISSNMLLARKTSPCRSSSAQAIHRQFQGPLKVVQLAGVARGDCAESCPHGGCRGAVGVADLVEQLVGEHAADEAAGWRELLRAPERVFYQFFGLFCVGRSWLARKSRKRPRHGSGWGQSASVGSLPWNGCGFNPQPSDVVTRDVDHDFDKWLAGPGDRTFSRLTDEP